MELSESHTAVRGTQGRLSRSGKAAKHVTYEQLHAAKQAKSKRGVAGKVFDREVAAAVEAGKIEVPVGSSIGTRDRRVYAAGPDTGPQEHRARMLLHVTEWVEEKLQIRTGGWRVMQPGREEAITDSLKGMRVEGKGVGRTAVRVALVELAAAQRLEVQVVHRGPGGAARHWAQNTLQWAVKAGWMDSAEAAVLLVQARGNIKALDPSAPVLLELGMGWGGLTDPAQGEMKAHGGRVVTMDEAQQYLGEGRGYTQPEILGTFEGRKMDLIEFCSKQAKFQISSMWGVFLSLSCKEESHGNHMQGGKGPHAGMERSEKAERGIDAAVGSVLKWVAGGKGRFYFVELPFGSTLVKEGDSRMAALGEPVVVYGCAYGLKHQKKYHLWTNLEVGPEGEFFPLDPKVHCPACMAGVAHEQGLIPQKGSSQHRVHLPGYGNDAARNRMPWGLGEAIVEGFQLAQQRDCEE